MTRVVVSWPNRFGEFRQHTLFNATLSYARNWWRENILECQGILSRDERRSSQLTLTRIEGAIPDHEHVWGPVEHARFTGTPHRKCAECGFVTLDLQYDELDCV